MPRRSVPTRWPARTRSPLRTEGRTGWYVVRSGGCPEPLSRMDTTHRPATRPANDTRPAATARTGRPAPEARSTPRWPAAHGSGGGSQPRSTRGRRAPLLPRTGQTRPATGRSVSRTGGSRSPDAWLGPLPSPAGSWGSSAADCSSGWAAADAGAVPTWGRGLSQTSSPSSTTARSAAHVAERAALRCRGAREREGREAGRARREPAPGEGCCSMGERWPGSPSRGDHGPELWTTGRLRTAPSPGRGDPGRTGNGGGTGRHGSGREAVPRSSPCQGAGPDGIPAPARTPRPAPPRSSGAGSPRCGSRLPAPGGRGAPPRSRTLLVRPG